MSKKLIAEVFGAVTVVVVTILWLFGTFQSQAASAREEANLTRRLDGQRDRILNMEEKIDQMSEDVSYIKGRIDAALERSK